MNTAIKYSGKNRELSMKNALTGKCDTIVMQDIEKLDWGFHFFVDSELEAYKAAYHYKRNPHGVNVEFAGGAQRWMVTVFNETAVKAGISN